jgi:flagellin-like hook-associated protein FlgL
MVTVSPFAPGFHAARRDGQAFGVMRRELDDLQRQLATGKRADTLSGLGLGRRTSLDVRAKLSAIAGHQDAIADGKLRLDVMTKGLESLAKAAGDQKRQASLTTFDAATGGRAALQLTAMNNLKHAIEVLNGDVNGRYLYSGRMDDTRPVRDLSTILDGAGGLRGLRQVIRDAQAENRGLPPLQPLGRLTLGGTGANATIDETLASAQLGFTIDPALPPAGSPSIGAAHVPGAPGAAGLSFTVNVVPQEGERVRFTLGLKDGTSVTVDLAARGGGTSDFDATSFRIGTDEDATAANLRGAIAAAVRAAVPTLDAASGAMAADRFFAGTEPNAVRWYDGETTAAVAPDTYATAARNGVPVRADTAQAVGIGARANELPFRNLLAGLAIMAVEPFDADPAKRTAEAARFSALVERSSVRLDPTSVATDPDFGQSNVKEVIVDLANASAALDGAKSRHQAAKAMWEDALAGVEEASPEATAAALLALQTRMQASYQTTAILSKLSLVNYL